MKKYKIYGEWYPSNIMINYQGTLLRKSFDTEEEANRWLDKFTSENYDAWRFSDKFETNFETELADVDLNWE